jgi:hypothetical protein
MMTVLEKGPKHQANRKSEVCKGKGCASDENGALGCSVDADSLTKMENGSQLNIVFM